MTGGAWPGADVPAASQNETARPGDTAAGRATVPAGGRVRQASRRGWPWVWALASGVVAAAAVRVPGAAVAGLSRQRAGFGRAAGVLARTVAGLLADAGLLAACSGLPVPRRGLLFAYAAGQLAGRLVPLPGGLGGVEGGVLDPAGSRRFCFFLFPDRPHVASPPRVRTRTP